MIVDEQVTRRGLVEALARLAALPAGAHFLGHWAKPAQAHDHKSAATGSDESALATYAPQFFPPDDFKALQAITELLIPTDETPGAREAHCAQFLDFMLHSMDNFSPETQAQWRTALAAFKTAGFHAADDAGKAALLREIAKPDFDANATHAAYTAYRLIKRENTFAFYTAKAGIIGSLDYRGNTYNVTFPACTHPEHHRI